MLALLAMWSIIYIMNARNQSIYHLNMQYCHKQEVTMGVKAIIIYFQFFSYAGLDVFFLPSVLLALS
ncbi:hypothetical protein SG71_16285 [Enterobacter chengduensis]|uniref:Uncharacterized protein n=1 Tax=Enterobacter chengduensis TaxID=2494701 RepID=A0AAW3HEB2_9ENTR|nr:hypothetical protein SG71_16285 [Enterobacter chengduensis]OTW34839.1 hypothetical protein CAP57_11740 [Enterobacter kobei]